MDNDLKVLAMGKAPSWFGRDYWVDLGKVIGATIAVIDGPFGKLVYIPLRDVTDIRPLTAN